MTNELRPPHQSDEKADGAGRRGGSRGVARDFGPNAPPQRYPDPDIVVIDRKRFRAKVGNTAIQRLYTGCLWAEGPAWNAQGQYLVWSDIPNNRQLRYLDENGFISENFRKPTNEANGNTFDFQGRQITCERTRMVRYEHNGSLTVLAEQADGKPLNGPNDVVVHPDDGRRIGQIRLPEACANLCFGGKKRNRLFMTASQSLYAVYVETQGAHNC